VNLHKIWLIAKREYQVNFRRKSFLFTAFGMPILLVVIWAVVFGLIAQAIDDTSGFNRVGVVDEAAVITDTDGNLIIELPAPFELFASAAAAELATRLDNPAVATRLQNPLGEMELYRVGSTQPLDESALMISFMAPVFVGLLIFILTMTTSQFLMSGLIEEKENRMMELFVTSSRPSEMLWGKMLGLGLLGITQILIWIAFGVVYLILSGALNLPQVLAGVQLSPGLIFIAVVYSILGYMVYGALMAGIGATVNAEQEGRQLATWVTLPGILPLMFMFVFLTDPNGTVAVVLSLFPLTAPVSMIVRAALASVPPIQIVIGLAIMAVSVVAIMQLSARIFRLGMLNYGKRPNLRQMLRAITARQQQVLTSTAHAAEGEA
jgi:ABC-type Na+ efflux pump permease subunit